MTPKEKAIELYSKYDELLKAPFKSHDIMKGCALIAVDELIEESFGSEESVGRYNYWQEVKKEIEAL